IRLVSKRQQIQAIHHPFPSQICDRMAPGTIMGSPTNCSEFYMCRNGRPVLFACPENMYFDVDTSACGYEAFCADNDVDFEQDPYEPPVPEYRPIEANPSQLVPTQTSVCRGAAPGAVRTDTTGCSAFYQCTKAGPLRLECPAGTLFDSNRLVCDAADIVSCAYAPPKPSIGGGGTGSGNLLEILCFGKKNGYKFAHPTNCARYVVCNGRNKAQEFTCPTGTAYNKQRKICDFTHNVEC
uniref:Chitin-binding type-2 domain-containing protein n=1 Tax=Anopheles coluzzii TaxID=1518534 RepID=A0A6E8W5J0_ANOCL